jgi:hypothetical protein
MLPSIAKKVIMSETGLFLILFLTPPRNANPDHFVGQEVYPESHGLYGNQSPETSQGSRFGPRISDTYWQILYHNPAQSEGTRPVSYAKGSKSPGMGFDNWAARNMIIFWDSIVLDSWY